MEAHVWRDGTVDWPVIGRLRWCKVCGLHHRPEREEMACEGPPTAAGAIVRKPTLVVDNTSQPTFL